jgi:hypothetical protein
VQVDSRTQGGFVVTAERRTPTASAALVEQLTAVERVSM